MDKVSVVMPIYNAEKYLPAAIDSVLKQTYKELELILVNDGSNDQCEKICQEYVKKDSRVRYFYKENGGLCSARNRGIAEATGEILCFIDNDDEMDKHLLEENVRLLQQYEADIVKFGRKRRNYIDGKLISEVDSAGISAQGIPEGTHVFYTKEEMKENFYNFYKGNIIEYIWDGLYRMSLIKRNHLKFREDFKNGHEDILMNMQCYERAGGIVLNNKVYYMHNWRTGQSASSKFSIDRIRDSIIVANYENKLFKKNGYSMEIILSVYMDNLFICMWIMSLGNECNGKVRRTLLSKYRENLNRHVPHVGRNIIRLMKHDYQRAILALMLKMRAYRIVWLLYILYTKKYVSK